MVDTSSFIIVALIAGGIAGLVVGLFPLIIGLIMKQNKLAYMGLGFSIVAGIILGLLAAIPTALGFAVAIALKSRDVRKTKVDHYDF